jgi:phosphate transport system substrate-binding protein
MGIHFWPNPGGNYVLRSLRVFLCLFVLASCAFAQTTLNGAGATFPYPIYSKWFSEYHTLHSDIQINYQSIGSGGGIRQVQAGTVDFGATDGPMSDEQIAQSKVKVLHVPTVLGAVVPAYNIPGVSADVKFTPDALAGIFLGKISKWNDQAISSANPGVHLPDQNITVIHRSDGSGTTYIFTDYLSKVNKQWADSVGRNTSVKWPVGIGGKGNEGVAGSIRQLPGSIGYIELIYALQNKIPYGVVENSSKNFIKASLESTTAAVAGVKMPADFRVSITNSPAKNAYPIASFTWLLIPTHPSDANKGRILKDFLYWMLDKGQTMVEALSYAPLPKDAVEKEKAAISSQIH